jgi:integrase
VCSSFAWPSCTWMERGSAPASSKCAAKQWRLFRGRNSRHTFSTLLIANGENVKVVQELMRHASSRCTLEVYSQARIPAKRQAQQRVVQMILPKEADAPEPLLACESQIDIR